MEAMRTGASQRRSPALGVGGVRALLYVLFVVAGVAQAAIVPLLPRISDRYHLPGAQTALLLALPGLASLVVSLPAGIASDRLGARRMTLVAGGLICVSSLAQAVPSLEVLLAGRAVFGLAFGAIWTTGMAWLAELQGARSASLGAPVTYSSVGVMAGPALSGALAQQAGVGAPFLLLAAAAAVVTATLVAVGSGAGGAPAVDPLVPQRPPVAEPPGRVADGLQEPLAPGDAILADPGVSLREMCRLLARPRVGAAAGALVISGAVSSVSQLLISTGLHRAGLSTSAIGLAFTAGAVCYISVSGAVVRLGGRVLTLRFNALAAVLAAVGLAPAPRGAISTVAYGLASGQRRGSATGDGVVFGLLNGAWAAATVLAPVIAGAFAQSSGAAAGYLTAIVPSAAIAVWVAIAARGEPRGPAGRRRAPAPQTPEPRLEAGAAGAPVAVVAGAGGRLGEREAAKNLGDDGAGLEGLAEVGALLRGVALAAVEGDEDQQRTGQRRQMLRVVARARPRLARRDAKPRRRRQRRLHEPAVHRDRLAAAHQLDVGSHPAALGDRGGRGTDLGLQLRERA